MSECIMVFFKTQAHCAPPLMYKRGKLRKSPNKIFNYYCHLWSYFTVKYGSYNKPNHVISKDNLHTNLQVPSCTFSLSIHFLFILPTYLLIKILFRAHFLDLFWASLGLSQKFRLKFDFLDQ